jgi:hypothetical protein
MNLELGRIMSVESRSALGAAKCACAGHELTKYHSRVFRLGKWFRTKKDIKACNK